MSGLILSTGSNTHFVFENISRTRWVGQGEVQIAAGRRFSFILEKKLSSIIVDRNQTFKPARHDQNTEKAAYGWNGKK